MDKNSNFTTSSEVEKTYTNVNTIDSINNIGSIMTSKMLGGLQGSLTKTGILTSMGKVNDANGFTPLSASTIDLWNQMITIDPTTGKFGPLTSQWGNADDTFGKKTDGSDGHYPTDSTGDKQTTNLNDPFADLSENVNQPKSLYGTGLGRSLVMNSPFQFNPNDDVRSDSYFPHLGRVFNEKIYSNYPIAIFEVGHIKYNNSLLSGTVVDDGQTDQEAMDAIKGSPSDIGQIAGGLITTGANVVKTILRTSWSLVTLDYQKLFGLKKYAFFERQTDLYAAYVNDLMVTLASMMGLLGSSGSGKYYGSDYDGLTASYDNGNTANVAQDLLKDPNADNYSKVNGDFYSSDDDKTFDNYAGRISSLRLKYILPSATIPSYDYIPFLINKDVSASESISNQTQQNPLQATLNGNAADVEARKDNGGQTGNGNVVTETKDAVSANLQNFANTLMRGESGTVISGEGRIALPEVWMDSSFSKSYSLNFKFSSPYGNDLAIFENVYIPFILLFCMAMPRQIGSKTYTSPFAIRVNAKGMFNIPMGIIESMSIERGEDKNSWTNNDRPRTLKCSINIKDISPTMMMTMNRGVFFPMFMGNDGLTSYLNVLGGLGIRDQIELAQNAGRWFSKVEDRLKGIGHIAQSVGNMLTGNSNSSDVSVLSNLRSFPVFKPLIDLSQRLGIGDTGDDIRSVM